MPYIFGAVIAALIGWVGFELHSLRETLKSNGIKVDTVVHF